MKNDICICIPTLNEASSIEKVINKFKNQGYENIIVIDGGSTDNTVQNAEECNVNVVEQTWHGGKGAAMREAIELINSEIIVFIDGDLTYEVSDIDALIKPIITDNIDHVLACRFADLKPDSMSRLHIFGNKLINILFRIVYNKNVNDLLTGFRAIKKDSVSELDLESDGFCIETEITSKSVMNGHNIKVIQSSYYKREGESKLNSYKDGFRIVYSIFKYRFD